MFFLDFFKKRLMLFIMDSKFFIVFSCIFISFDLLFELCYCLVKYWFVNDVIEILVNWN